ncbi:hypothetical protein ABPG75_010508 [Micractinium tetrahymenae]
MLAGRMQRVMQAQPLLHDWAALAAAAASGGAAATRTAGFASAAGAEPDLRQAFSYCVNQVKQHDYESYLWVTQLPKELRAPIFALRAFNVETALIGEHAKSEMLVLMRCQWWRDAVNDCYKGRPPAQPVITALAAVLQQRPLTRYRLQQVVSTRENDLLSLEQPASLAALEQYADGTAGQLLALQLEAAGIGGSSIVGVEGGSSSDGSSSAAVAAAEHAAAHLGKAVGIVGLLRGTYAHGAQRRVYLPADMCAAHGVGAEDVLAGRDSPGMRDAVLAVAAAAKQHLDAARQLVADAPPAARPLFAPGVAAGMYLAALEKAGFNLFDPAMLRKGGAVPLLAYQLRLKWALLRGTGF